MLALKVKNEIREWYIILIRKGIDMNYYDSIKRAIDFIEKNIEYALPLKSVANEAGFSLHHFHRIFQFNTGYSLMEYIRLRRMSMAGAELIEGMARILDLSVKYQFGSQESFTRAFKAAYGVTPGKYRKAKLHTDILKPFDVNTLLYANLGGRDMKYEVINIDGFKAVGMMYYGTNENGEIPALWGAFLPRIKEIDHRVGKYISYGVCEPVETEGDEFKYYACVSADSLEDIPEGMESIEVEHQKYVRFIHEGSVDTLGDTYKKIYAEIILREGYDLVTTYDFEMYDEKFDPESEASIMYIYVPIK